LVAFGIFGLRGHTLAAILDSTRDPALGRAEPGHAALGVVFG
jgi:hypothetical protein